MTYIALTFPFTFNYGFPSNFKGHEIAHQWFGILVCVKQFLDGVYRDSDRQSVFNY